jgi:phosphoribosylanthranilate isomerase
MSTSRLPRPFIQAAGVCDAGEAAMLAAAGFTHLGFPLRLPVHAPDLSEAAARDVILGLAPETAAVLVTYLADPAEILALCDVLGVDWVQLHGDLAPSAAASLRAARPGLGIIKSLVVGRGQDAGLPSLARTFAPNVDAFITDSYDPASGACGATGRTHDWAVSRRLAAEAGRPLILAGGLNPDNLAAAVAAVRPAGVDAHTGLEAPDGSKDPDRCRRFAALARTLLVPDAA